MSTPHALDTPRLCAATFQCILNYTIVSNSEQICGWHILLTLNRLIQGIQGLSRALGILLVAEPSSHAKHLPDLCGN
jgi:hypothetical protein